MKKKIIFNHVNASASTRSLVEYSSDKSFSGRFTDVNMYRGVLDDTSLENFSKCRSLNGRSVIVDWNVNAFDGNEIDVEDVSNDVLCAKRSL